MPLPSIYCSTWTKGNRGTYLREALIEFAHFVLDFQIPLDLLDDAQIRGRAERLQAEAEETASARPLTADEVRRLKKMMELPICDTAKYLLGGVLFAIFSRSRWSDLQFIDRMWLDQTEHNGEPFGFLEARDINNTIQEDTFYASRLSYPWNQRCSLDHALAGYL